MFQIFVEFDWIRLISHEYCPECTMIYKNLLRNTVWMLEISYESVKTIPVNPLDFLARKGIKKSP